MITIVHKGDNIDKEPTPDCIIKINRHLPSSKTTKEMRKVYKNDAKKISKVLSNLPRGTTTCLLIELLKKQEDYHKRQV